MSTKTIRTILAERIKAQRVKQGLSQAELAKMINVKSTSTVGNWESGTATPDYDKLVFLADLFGVTTDYLLGVTTTHEQHNNGTLDVTAEEIALLEKIRHCDEASLGAIHAIISYYDTLSSNIPDLIQKQQAHSTSSNQRLFLIEGKDEDYDRIKEKIPYLKKLKKASRKSYMDITSFLWDLGYGGDICLAYVIDLFSLEKNSRVPNQTLYNQIEAYLKKKYMIITNVTQE